MQMTRPMERFACRNSMDSRLVPTQHHRHCAWAQVPQDLTRVLSWRGPWNPRCCRVLVLKLMQLSTRTTVMAGDLRHLQELPMLPSDAPVLARLAWVR